MLRCVVRISQKPLLAFAQNQRKFEARCYLDVGNSGQLAADSRALRGHTEHREQTQAYAGRDRLDIDPEGHPTQDHDEN